MHGGLFYTRNNASLQSLYGELMVKCIHNLKPSSCWTCTQAAARKVGMPQEVKKSGADGVARPKPPKKTKKPDVAGAQIVRVEAVRGHASHAFLTHATEHVHIVGRPIGWLFTLIFERSPHAKTIRIESLTTEVVSVSVIETARSRGVNIVPTRPPPVWFKRKTV